MNAFAESSYDHSACRPILQHLTPLPRISDRMSLIKLAISRLQRVKSKFPWYLTIKYISLCTYGMWNMTFGRFSQNLSMKGLPWKPIEGQTVKVTRSGNFYQQKRNNSVTGSQLETLCKKKIHRD